MKECKDCGKEFTRAKRSPCCSDECSKAVRKAGRAAYESTPAAIANKKLYQARYRSKASIKEYQKVYHNGYGSTPSGSAARSRRAALRKEQFLAAYVEDVDRQTVMNRDKWLCGICGCPVDRSISWPNLWSPSMDHIIPLSKGGKHCYENVQCSHMGCNISKRDL